VVSSADDGGTSLLSETGQARTGWIRMDREGWIGKGESAGGQLDSLFSMDERVHCGLCCGHVERAFTATERHDWVEVNAAPSLLWHMVH
jgi:hypothetical protein